MKLHIIPLFAFLAGLGFCAQGLTQTVTERETEIHKNIRLIEVAVPKNIPADLVRQYRDFLPMFKETLKDVTRDQEYKDRLVIRVSAGIVEIGSSGVKYAQVRATSFCGNSKNEYVGNFLLHDFQTDGPVDREMTETFMRKQLLEPLQCYVPVARAAVPAKPRVVPEPAVVRIRVDPPMEKIEDTGQKRQSPVQPEAEPEAESEPEFELHKNVYLFTTDAEPDVPEDLAVQYRNFLPVLREIVRGNTRDQSEENRLIMRVAIGTREVGPGKTRRAHARITSLV
ncbi:MAG TPA: hypothetical protein VLL97_04165, partial [Acidobacteriota bacterium]|nr:hypothetical protein [Acidobacteriota bacterium]